MKKFIDEKGRIFGKVNIIDILVVLLVLAVAAAVIFKAGGGEVTKADQLANAEMKDISYTVLCRMVHNDVANHVVENAAGQQLMSNGELVESCFVEDVQCAPYYESFLTDSGEVLQVENPTYCDLIITVSGQAPYGENSCHGGSQWLHICKAARPGVF